MADDSLQRVDAPSVTRSLEMPVISGPNRIHYLDNLRAIAMTLGVFLHAALAYANPAQSIWLATDTTSSVAIDLSIWYVHLFRMSLFFLLAGYFAKVMIHRKGIKTFLWNRTVRLAFPFLLFYPCLLAAMTAVIVFSLSYLDEPKGLMGFIAAAAKENQDPNRKEPLTTMHLWFLYYLFMFSIIGALVSRLRWLNWDWTLKRPWLLGFLPIALLPGSILAGTPLPAPESFIPIAWPFAFYGLFYWAGWQLYGREHNLEQFASAVWYILAASGLLFIPYYIYMPTLDLNLITKGEASLPLSCQVFESLLTSYLAVSLTIASLLLGKRYLCKQSPLLRFISDSSYWVYLIHLPIVLFLQTVLIPLEWNVWAKLLLTMFGTIFLCLASYLVFVRYTPIGWLLNGKRSFP